MKVKQYVKGKRFLTNVINLSNRSGVKNVNYDRGCVQTSYQLTVYRIRLQPIENLPDHKLEGRVVKLLASHARF